MVIMIVPFSQSGARMCAYIFNFYSFCRQICVSPLLSRELREFVQYWNSHKLRKNRTAEYPQTCLNITMEATVCNQLCALWINAMNDAPAMLYEMYLNCHELVEEQFNIDLERQLTNCC